MRARAFSALICTPDRETRTVSVVPMRHMRRGHDFSEELYVILMNEFGAVADRCQMRIFTAPVLRTLSEG